MNYIRDEQNCFVTCLFVNVCLIEKKNKEVFIKKKQLGTNNDKK